MQEEEFGLEISFGRKNDALTVKISGEIDHFSCGLIRERTDREYIQRRLKSIELDLSGVTFADSSVIGLIIGRQKVAKSFGGRVSVVGAEGVCERIIRLSALEKIVDVTYGGGKRNG